MREQKIDAIESIFNDGLIEFAIRTYSKRMRGEGEIRTVSIHSNFMINFMKRSAHQETKTLTFPISLPRDQLRTVEVGFAKVHLCGFFVLFLFLFYFI